MSELSAGAALVSRRRRFLEIGLVAVSGSCAVFAIARLALELQTGKLTPWWANALGFVVLAGLWRWYQKDRQTREGIAVHVTAATALVCLAIPVAYGMGSTVWWYSLVGFGMTLLGSRREAYLWLVVVVTLTLVTLMVEPHIQIDGAAGETPIEVAMSRVVFVLVLVGMAFAFRGEVESLTDDLWRSRDEATRANEAKAQFLAQMSHELRTPLHGVIGMTDLVLQGPLPLSARSNLQTAHTSASTLLQLLNDVLELSRADGASTTLVAHEFHLHSALGAVLRPLQKQAQMKGLRFSATAEEGLVAGRIGDSTRLSQVVLNLVTNAIKFTPTGGITIYARGESREAVLIEVTDTGRGIPEALRDHIFEPFAQIESSDAENLKGKGLGLAISREIARRMGGDIWVEPTAAGACLIARVILPLSKDSQVGYRDLLQPVHPQRSGIVPCRPLRLLGAEDEPTNRLLLKRMAKLLGHEILLVENGAEALTALEEGVFDVLLTDLQMPVLDGIGLCQALWDEGVEIPIILCTAQAHLSDVPGLDPHRIQGHLIKPFRVTELSEVLAQVTTTASS